MDVFRNLRHALTAPNRGTPEHMAECLRRHRAERAYIAAGDGGAHPRLVEKLRTEAYGDGEAIDNSR